MGRLAWAVAALLVASPAMADGFSKFYQPATVVGPIEAVPKGTVPQVITSSGDPTNDVQTMYVEGYRLIGFSSFNGPLGKVSGAIAQAKKIGATRIVLSSQFRSTSSGSIPLTLPTTVTSQTNGSVMAGGRFGSYNGTSTTTSSQTTYIPYSVDRYEQTAAYFAPAPKVGTGAGTRPLTPDEAKQRGSNIGLQVGAVRRGSPAFLADVLPGDVIVKYNDEPAYDPALLLAASMRSGALVLVIERGGATVTKELRMGEGGQW